TESSDSAVNRASSSAWVSSVLRALSLSGRFSRSTRTASWSSVSSTALDMSGLPAHDAEPGPRDHAVQFPAQRLLAQPRHRQHLIQVQPGADAHRFEGVDKILSGHVAGQPLAVLDLGGMTADAAEGAVELPAACVECGERVGD